MIDKKYRILHTILIKRFIEKIILNCKANKKF